MQCRRLKDSLLSKFSVNNMATQIKQEEIITKYQELPEDLQKALVSSSFSNAITETGKKEGLAIDKIGELAEETGFVMLGMTAPADYVKNLTARLGVPAEKAKMIAEEINQKVFQPVRESLKKVHGLSPEAPKVESRKPLPTIADLGIGRMPKKEEIVSYIEETKARIASEKAPGKETIPPIFVKNVPPPAGEPTSEPEKPKQPDIMPEKSLAAKNELEKALGQPIPPTPLPPEHKYQTKDPYRELIE